MNERALDALFERFRDHGDGAALAALFDATAPALLGVARHLIRDAAEAEDLVQATFLAAIEGAGRYDGRAPVQAWLHGILWRNAAKARREAARAIEPRRLPERGESEPLEGLAAAEVPAAVERALGRLPERYREVLTPHLHDGRRPEDIARALRRSPGTVRSQLHRGLARLRRALPAGLAPVTGVGGISTRGLERVREEVLQRAGAPSAAASAPAALAGLAVSKVALAASAAALLALSAWIVRATSADRLEGIEATAPPVVAASAGAAVDLTRGLAPEPAPREARTAEVEQAAGDAAVPAAAPGDDGDGEPGASDADELVAYWRARFLERPDDWRHGWSVAAELAGQLDPDEAARVMAAVWPDLGVPVKEQVLKPFVFHGGHPRALDVLHLAATDASLGVQERAFGYLKAYAFQDFAEDYAAYLRWAEIHRGRPLAEVLADNAQRFVRELSGLSSLEVARRMEVLDRLDLRAGEPCGVDLPRVLRDAGALEVLESCLRGGDPEAQQRALRWSKDLRADEAWLRAWVVPAIGNLDVADRGLRSAAFDALARPDCAWAREEIVTELRRIARLADEQTPTYALGARSAASALAEIGDPAAIPALITLLQEDTTGDLLYDVGYFGLSKLTGVTWDESCDADFWLGWWDKNADRLPAHVAATPIGR